MEIRLDLLRQYIHMWHGEWEGLYLEVFSARALASDTGERNPLEMAELQRGLAAWRAAHPNYHTRDVVQHLADDGTPELWVYCEKEPEPPQPPPPLGNLPYLEREPHLLAVLRPGVADLLTKIVTRRRPNNGGEATGIEFIEWMTKRHNFECYLCQDGTPEARAADLLEEVFDLSRREAQQSDELNRLHDALLAIDRAQTDANSPGEALAEIRRITQAALNPEADPTCSAQQG